MTQSMLFFIVIGISVALMGACFIAQTYFDDPRNEI